MDNEDGTTSVISDSNSNRNAVKASQSSDSATVTSSSASKNKSNDISNNNNMGPAESVDNGPMISSRGHGATSYMSKTYNLNTFQSQCASRDNNNDQKCVLRKPQLERNCVATTAIQSDEIISRDDVAPDTATGESESTSSEVGSTDCIVSTSTDSVAAPQVQDKMSVTCATRLLETERRDNCDYETKETKSSLTGHYVESESESGVGKKDGSAIPRNSGHEECAIDLASLSALQHAVQAVKKVPFADPEEVKNLLENDSIKSKPTISSPKSEVNKSSPSSESGSEETMTESDTITFSDDSRKCDEGVDLVEQQLMNDVKEICKIFPNKDQYEIYSYVEAHIHKPDRIQIVVDELLGMLHSSQESSLRSSPVDTNSSAMRSAAIEAAHGITALQSLQAIFPNVDAELLDSILRSQELNEERNQSLIDDLEQMSMFPRLQKALMCKLERSTLKMHASERFLITAFLELFDSPEEYFYDESSPVSEAYKKHAIACLYDLFPDVLQEHIDAVLRNHRFHYTPALRQLQYELDMRKPELHGQSYFIFQYIDILFD